MLLRLYNVTIIFALIALATAAIKIKSEAKKEFTAEELKLVKKSKQNITWCAIAVILIVPVLNVLIGLIYIFCYGKIRDRVLNDYRHIIHPDSQESI